MRGRRNAVVAGALVAGGLYWLVVARVAGVDEPWDSPAYWRLFYPVALVLSAALGVVRRRDGWLAGAMLMLAQLPVVLIGGSFGPLFMVGLLVAGVLAVPAAAVAFLAGRVATRARGDQ